jgi:hypothetical protein
MPPPLPPSLLAEPFKLRSSNHVVTPDIDRCFKYQVSLAVLLDNFVAASARLEAKEVEQKISQQKVLRQFKNPLEPLVARHVA